jgi:hypothetical protein
MNDAGADKRWELPSRANSSVCVPTHLNASLLRACPLTVDQDWKDSRNNTRTRRDTSQVLHKRKISEAGRKEWQEIEQGKIGQGTRP